MAEVIALLYEKIVIEEFVIRVFHCIYTAACYYGYHPMKLL